MFAQPDEYIILVFSLIAIVFWYRPRTRVEMSRKSGTESKLRGTSFLVPFQFYDEKPEVNFFS
jgi:hypothetical protein